MIDRLYDYLNAVGMASVLIAQLAGLNTFTVNESCTMDEISAGLSMMTVKAWAITGINKFAKEVDRLIKRSKPSEHSVANIVYTADLHTFASRDAEVRDKLLTTLNETMRKHFEVIYDGEDKYLTVLQLVIDLVDIRDVEGELYDEKHALASKLRAYKPDDSEVTVAAFKREQAVLMSEYQALMKKSLKTDDDQIT
jgi:hypothetical protein